MRYLTFADLSDDLTLITRQIPFANIGSTKWKSSMIVDAYSYFPNWGIHPIPSSKHSLSDVKVLLSGLAYGMVKPTWLVRQPLSKAKSYPVKLADLPTKKEKEKPSWSSKAFRECWCSGRGDWLSGPCDSRLYLRISPQKNQYFIMVYHFTTKYMFVM